MTNMLTCRRQYAIGLALFAQYELKFVRNATYYRTISEPDADLCSTT